MEKQYNLLRVRKEKGLTLQELSKLSGVYLQTIQKIESGITPIDSVKLGTLVKLAKALKCKVKDLVNVDLRKYIA